MSLKKKKDCDNNNNNNNNNNNTNLLSTRWQDEPLCRDLCFTWLREWTSSPNHTISGEMELYQQPTPTRVYTSYKRGTTQGM